MTDGKEWVTIKIPKDTRDDAKDDPRTYEEIMQSGLGQSESHGRSEDERALEKVAQRMHRMEHELSTLIDVVQDGDTDVEEVLGRLDDLETTIPSKTADELEGRFKR